MSDTSLPLATPVTRQLIRGALECEQTLVGLLPHRLPATARSQFHDVQLGLAESQPSGIRLAFRTAATVLELVVLPTRRVYAGMPPRLPGIYDLFVDGRLVDKRSVDGGSVLRINMSTGSAALELAEPRSLRFDNLSAQWKAVEIWLPHDEATELIALRSDAPILAMAGPDRPTWVHHGSSISQGSNAAHPSATWPAVAATRAGAEVVNLGFGGGALLDPFVARAIRNMDPDVISLKIGINLINMDLMRRRVFVPAVHGFLDTIREGHPTAPLWLVSPILCPMHEDVPGPTRFDLEILAQGRLQFRASGNAHEAEEGKLTLARIWQELADIVRQRARQDPNLHYLDGLDLYGAEQHLQWPLPGGLHPDTDSHRHIGERFAALALSSTFREAGMRREWHPTDDAPLASEITPREIVEDRRRFIAGIAAGAALGFSVWEMANRKVFAGERAGPALAAGRNPVFSTSETPTSAEDATRYNNYYEFEMGKSDPARHAHTLQVRP